MESGHHIEGGTIKSRIELESVENKDIIKEILIDALPPLTTVVNIEGDRIIEGLVVVERQANDYDENSFGPFVISPNILDGGILSNHFNNILDNMIQPFINQSNEVINRDIKDLVTKVRVEKLIEIEVKERERHGIKY